MNEISGNFLSNSDIKFGIENFDANYLIFTLAMMSVMTISVCMLSQIKLKAINKNNKYLIIVPFLIAPILIHTGIVPYKYKSNEELLESYYSSKMYDVMLTNEGIFPENEVVEKFISLRDNNSRDGVNYFENNKNDILSVTDLENKKIDIIYSISNSEKFKNKVDEIRIDNIITINEYKELKEYLERSNDEYLYNLNLLLKPY